MTPMKVSLRNRARGPVVVDRIRLRIVKITAPNATAHRRCTRFNFRIRQIPPQRQVRVPARRQVTFLSGARLRRPAIGIVNRPFNQNGCKGAALKLRFSARVRGR
jgi:hypothetical protein